MSALPWHSDIEQAILASVNTLVRHFQVSPYAFLCESDLEATLLLELRSRIRGRLQIPSSKKTPPTYELDLVYSQYNNRIDIACLDPELANSAITRTNRGLDTYIYHLPIFVGIDIRYLKMGDDFNFTACLNDFEKLTRLEITRPLVLGFLQDDGAAGDFLSDRFLTSKQKRVCAEEVNDFRRIYVISPENVWAVSEA